MAATSEGTHSEPVLKKEVCVFGGTGFLGQRIVSHLLALGCGVRVVSRHPHEPTRPHVAAVKADIRDPASLAGALVGADALVNAVSLYAETPDLSFADVHVTGAAALARAASESRIAQFVQLSGIGANPDSDSAYIRARGEGEAAVRWEKPNAVIVRPSVMFGPEDGFLETLQRIIRLSPVLPLFGSGDALLQPVYVENVAEAIARILTCDDHHKLYEFGGPRIYTYREIVETIARVRARRLPLLLPTPFAVWRAAARAGSTLGLRAVSTTEIELMERDNVASDLPGLAELGVTPTSIETFLYEN
ncbi:complex I NDUFA9 subunit family protein [Afifella sp. IM 167]|uniref:complex I NDUFA9 subunit family protein n=1 Tax=Afifella sp. IM 167 TaxID=2033586 RepID=UPI001CCDE881|nr:complex I NDUFA9 subunit family protein [Afifella sp. IM 167]MBZ8134749.1 epimerase [Afifella sp. IM 167]